MDTANIPDRAHLIGISGAGMLPLALCLDDLGVVVTGEDDACSEVAMAILGKRGIELGSFASQAIGNGDTWILRSAAIAESHPSVRLARESGHDVLRRGEGLALLAERKRLIGVAGSHGKTSTTGMLIDLLEEAGENACYAIGGLFADGRDSGRWTDSEWLVLELDESDGTIERFNPEVGVILNADHDHHAMYETEEDYLEVFKRLAERTGQALVLDESLKTDIGDGIEEKTIVYPSSDDSPLRESNQFGEYGESNHRMAVSAARLAGFDIPTKGIVQFSRLLRRQSCLYFSPRLKIIEDYAHHPVEIRSVREGVGAISDARTVAVFQPHRYSRTRSLKHAFAEELEPFDHVYLLDVYAASESPIEGGTGDSLYEACKARFAHCAFAPTEEALLDSLFESVGESSQLNVVFLGAGITDVLGNRLADRLKAHDKSWGRLFRELGKVADLQSPFRFDEVLASKTTLRVGGRAELYFEPSSLDELVIALKACTDMGMPARPLGRGSNLIVPDEGVSGLALRLSRPHWKRFERISDTEIRVGAGLRIKELCGAAAREGLEGFEFLEGIPGSIGGALRMNAGAMGGWMFDIVESVRYLTMDGVLVEANAKDLNVGYRHCRELESAIAIDAILAPKAIGRREADLRKAIDVYQSRRKESQPREPSAGCIFKNPENDSAGRLIEELGLKGTVIGGAEISGTHGNFIINRGGASSSDVIELVKLARRVARKERSVELEPEALLYGANWEDALK